MENANLPPLKAGYLARPCTLDDVEAVVDIINAHAIKIGEVPGETVEQTRANWQRPNFDQAANQRVVTNAESKIVAWAEIRDAETVLSMISVCVHPDYEHERIGKYLVAWVESRARQGVDKAPAEARVVLRAWSVAAEKDAWYSDLLQAAGLQLIRHSWRMEIELDKPQPEPKWPEGITLKVYDGKADKRPIFMVRRITFQDQFGYVERPFEEDYAARLRYWEGEGGFLPELWFLAMSDEKIVGICLCRDSHNGVEDYGWVSTLGVLREYRRKGIAEALLYTAFDALYKMGKKKAGLGVDASSLTGAATLYKRVGMHVARQFDLYEKELRAGVDLTTHG